MMPINPKANQGMVILLLPEVLPDSADLRLASAKLMITNTGASIMTRIILVMVAVPAMPKASVGSMALPAPATCATS